MGGKADGGQGADVSVKPSSRPPLSEAARRALAEAEERRRAQTDGRPAPEIHGRGGLDPTRYGDWEIKGLASDF